MAFMRRGRPRRSSEGGGHALGECAGRRGPRGGVRRHGLQRAQPAREGGGIHRRESPFGDREARFRAQRRRPPAASRPEPRDRTDHPRRRQPVLHRPGARRGSESGRRGPVDHPRQQRREGGTRVRIPGPLRGATDARRPRLPVRQHHPAPAPPPRAGHPRRAGGPHERGLDLQLRVRRRRGGRGDGGRPPARHRPPPHRLCGRTHRDPPGRRPARGRAPGRRRASGSHARGRAGGGAHRSPRDGKRAGSSPPAPRSPAPTGSSQRTTCSPWACSRRWSRPRCTSPTTSD